MIKCSSWKSISVQREMFKLDLGDLRFSDDSIIARYKIKKEYNTIHIFVEDKDKEYEYETIFQRLFEDDNTMSDDNIYTVGGKAKLIEIFKELGECNADDSKIKHIYIADGDFDRYLNPEKMINSPNFIYLETYNIENYFIDEKASVLFLKGKLKCTDREVKKRLDFDNWLNKIVEQSTKLFLLYCSVQRLNPSEPNVARNPYEFLDMNTGFERSDGAYDRYFRQQEKMNNNISLAIYDIKRKYEKINGNNYFNLICGKFLMTSLYRHILHITKSSFREDDFRWGLICYFDISKLDYLKNKIISIINS